MTLAREQLAELGVTEPSDDLVERVAADLAKLELDPELTEDEIAAMPQEVRPPHPALITAAAIISHDLAAQADGGIEDQVPTTPSSPGHGAPPEGLQLDGVLATGLPEDLRAVQLDGAPVPAFTEDDHRLDPETGDVIARRSALDPLEVEEDWDAE